MIFTGLQVHCVCRQLRLGFRSAVCCPCCAFDWTVIWDSLVVKLKILRCHSRVHRRQWLLQQSHCRFCCCRRLRHLRWTLLIFRRCVVCCDGALWLQSVPQLHSRILSVQKRTWDFFGSRIIVVRRLVHLPLYLSVAWKPRITTFIFGLHWPMFRLLWNAEFFELSVLFYAFPYRSRPLISSAVICNVVWWQPVK